MTKDFRDWKTFSNFDKDGYLSTKTKRNSSNMGPLRHRQGTDDGYFPLGTPGTPPSKTPELPKV